MQAIQPLHHSWAANYVVQYRSSSIFGLHPAFVAEICQIWAVVLQLGDAHASEETPSGIQQFSQVEGRVHCQLSLRMLCSSHHPHYQCPLQDLLYLQLATTLNSQVTPWQNWLA